VRLSNASGYAIQALTAMPEDGRFHPTRELAGRTHCPASFLTKVLQDLERAGLVDSLKGPRGGFRLARPAHRISLEDVVTAMEGPARSRNPCVMGLVKCLNGDRPCPLHRLFEAPASSLDQRILATTIRDLALVQSGPVAGEGLQGPVEGLPAELRRAQELAGQQRQFRPAGEPVGGVVRLGEGFQQPGPTLAAQQPCQAIGRLDGCGGRFRPGAGGVRRVALRIGLPAVGALQSQARTAEADPGAGGAGPLEQVPGLPDPERGRDPGVEEGAAEPRAGLVQVRQAH
jgi:Rrf2 family protein